MNEPDLARFADPDPEDWELEPFQPRPGLYEGSPWDHATSDPLKDLQDVFRIYERELDKQKLVNTPEWTCTNINTTNTRHTLYGQNFTPEPTKFDQEAADQWMKKKLNPLEPELPSLSTNATPTNRVTPSGVSGVSWLRSQTGCDGLRDRLDLV